MEGLAVCTTQVAKESEFASVAVFLARTLQSQLYGVSNDPLTISFATFFVVGLVMASALIPARRAAKVDPMVAMSYE